MSMDEGKVHFRWKDYRNGNKQKTMSLQAGEFIRRFMIHVLPDGFHRIRYTASSATAIGRGSRALPGTASDGTSCTGRATCRLPRPLRSPDRERTAPCPHCRTGMMVVIGCIARPGICQSISDTP